MAEIRVLWSGAPIVGGGVSTFYTIGDPVDAVGALDTFFGSIKAIFPSGTVIRVQQSGNTLDSNTASVLTIHAMGTLPAGAPSQNLTAQASMTADGISSGEVVVSENFTLAQ